MCLQQSESSNGSFDPSAPAFHLLPQTTMKGSTNSDQGIGIQKSVFELKKGSERNAAVSSMRLRPQPSGGNKLIPIRYGDTLRLWSRSPYLDDDEGGLCKRLSASAGGYVGAVKRKSNLRTSVLRR